MKTYFNTLVFILLSSVIAVISYGQEKFDYKSHVGLVLKGISFFCFSIKNSNVVHGTKLAVIRIPIAGSAIRPKLLTAEVIGRLDHQCDQLSLMNGDSSYSIYLIKDTIDDFSPCFGLLVSPDRLTLSGTSISGDIDLDGINEEFQMCTSSEGIHLSIWSVKPNQRLLRWHRYYYLGYDVERTCDDRIFDQ